MKRPDVEEPHAAADETDASSERSPGEAERARDQIRTTRPYRQPREFWEEALRRARADANELGDA